MASAVAARTMSGEPTVNDEREKGSAMIEFFAANWLWIAFVVFFVVMHRGGHGCGMHHGHHHQHVDRTARAPDTQRSSTDRSAP